MKSIVEYIKEARSKWYGPSEHIPYSKDYTEPEKAILEYVLGFTTAVNKVLRDGKYGDEIKDKMDWCIDNMDKGFNDTCKPGTTLYRTVSWDMMENLYEITKENIDKHIGDVLVDKGYMSTTNELQSPWGKSWNDWELVLVLTNDKPIPCFDVNKNIDKKDIDCEEQKEILLPRDTECRIDSYEVRKNEKGKKGKYDKNGTYFIYCTITKCNVK